MRKLWSEKCIDQGNRATQWLGAYASVITMFCSHKSIGDHWASPSPGKQNCKLVKSSAFSTYYEVYVANCPLENVTDMQITSNLQRKWAPQLWNDRRTVSLEFKVKSLRSDSKGNIPHFQRCLPKFNLLGMQSPLKRMLVIMHSRCYSSRLNGWLLWGKKSAQWHHRSRTLHESLISGNIRSMNILVLKSHLKMNMESQLSLDLGVESLIFLKHLKSRE